MLIVQLIVIIYFPVTRENISRNKQRRTNNNKRMHMVLQDFQKFLPLQENIHTQKRVEVLPIHVSWKAVTKNKRKQIQKNI